eukprot:m.40415 g.40415  ORF g.40415 m.40415 type:complete len:1120 (-) comp10319_c0_seq1:177-3536(-)
MEAGLGRRLQQLQRRLKEHGFTQPLDPTSVDLVAALLSSLEETKNAVHGGADAMTKDKALLIKEINDLNMELLRRREAAETQLRGARAGQRRGEQEATDLRYLNTQYAQRIRQLEKESQAKSERIDRLMEKSFTPTSDVIEREGRKVGGATRRQHMQIAGFLAAQDGPTHSRGGLEGVETEEGNGQQRVRVRGRVNFNKSEIDLLRATSERVRQLEESVTAFKEEKRELEGRLTTAQAQIKHRDEEVLRLSRLVEAGPASSVVRTSTREPATELADQVATLQNALAEQQHRVSVLVTRNDQLVREQEQAKLETTTKKEAAQARPRLTAREGETARLMGETQHLSRLLLAAEAEVRQLRGDVDVLTQDNKQLQERLRQSALAPASSDTLTALVDEKQAPQLQSRVAELSGQCAALTAHNTQLQELVRMLESTRTRLQGELASAKNTAASSSQLEAKLADALADRDNVLGLYRQALAELQRSGRQGQSTPSVPPTHSTPQPTSHELSSLRDELTETAARATSAEALVARLRSALTETERAKEESDEQAACATALQSRVLELERELTQTRATIRAYDQARDSLERDLETQTTTHTHLESELARKAAQVEDLEAALARDRSMTVRTARELEEKESEIARLQSQLDELKAGQEAVQAASRARAIENEHQREDLDTMTAEAQRLATEAEQAQRRRNELEEAVRDYVTRLKSIEARLVATEEEKEQLVTSIASLTRNTTTLDGQARAAAEQYTAARTTIRAYEVRVSELQQQLATLQSKSVQYFTEQIAQQTRMTELEEHLQRAQAQLQESEEHRREVEAQLETFQRVARSATLDHEEKEQQQAQLALENQNLRQEFQALAASEAAARIAATAHVAKVEEIEGVLAKERRRMYSLEVEYARAVQELARMHEQARHTLSGPSPLHHDSPLSASQLASGPTYEAMQDIAQHALNVTPSAMEESQENRSQRVEGIVEDGVPQVYSGRTPAQPHYSAPAQSVFAQQHALGPSQQPSALSSAAPHQTLVTSRFPTHFAPSTLANDVATRAATLRDMEVERQRAAIHARYEQQVRQDALRQARVAATSPPGAAPAATVVTAMHSAASLAQPRTLGPQLTVNGDTNHQSKAAN